MNRAAARAALAAIAILTPSAVPAQTVDEIVAKHVAARGGLAALTAVKSVRMTGRAVASDGRTAIIRREIARPGRIRTEFEFQGTTGIYAWNGSTGWQVSPLEGKFDAEPITAEAAAISAEQSDFEGPLVEWKKKGHKLQLVGSAALPGGKAFELLLTLKSGAQRHVFVDAASFLVVKTTTTRKVRGHDEALEVSYGDWRDVGGVRFAHALEIAVRDRPQRLRIVVEKVELNPPLDASRFAAPR